MRRVTRYVGQLLRGRRPRPFRASDEEADALRAAIALRGADPELSAPRPEFLIGLRRRLAAELDGAGNGNAGTAPVPAGSPRRRVLAGTAIAGAAAATTVIVEHAVTGTPSPSVAATLQPNDAIWQTVAGSADLPDGGVHPFDTGTVAGFVMRSAGRLWAVSGNCTHQGCRLRAGTDERRLDCPCHRTSFDLDGHVVRHQLPTSPAPLPAIEVRETGGVIQVLGANGAAGR